MNICWYCDSFVCPECKYKDPVDVSGYCEARKGYVTGKNISCDLFVYDKDLEEKRELVEKGEFSVIEHIMKLELKRRFPGITFGEDNNL